MPVLPRPIAGLRELHRPDADDPAHEWRMRAAEFAAEVVQPLGLALDGPVEPDQAAQASVLRDFLRQADHERFTRLTEDPDLGGAGLGHDAEYFVLEELATADAALAALVISTRLPHRWARLAGLASLVERLNSRGFAGERHTPSGCLYVCTRPDVLRARHHRGGFQLSGTTHAPFSGGMVASHALLTCAVEKDHQSRAVVILPLDRAGVERRAPDQRTGLRAAGAAALVLSEVRVGPDELIVDPTAIAGAVAVDHLTAAIGGVGIARAACEGAMRWLDERARRPTAQQLMMGAMLERARTLTRAAHCKTHRQLEAGRPFSPRDAALARLLATQTAAELARRASWIAGRPTLDQDGLEYLDGSRFRSSKLVRDAQAYAPTGRSFGRTARRDTVHPRERRSPVWGL